MTSSEVESLSRDKQHLKKMLQNQPLPSKMNLLLMVGNLLFLIIFSMATFEFVLANQQADNVELSLIESYQTQLQVSNFLLIANTIQELVI